MGLPLPEDPSRHLEAVLGQIRRSESLQRDRPRVVPVENLHLTIKFLGPRPPGLVPLLATVLDEVCGRHTAISTAIDDYTAFPSPLRARVVVARLHDPAGRLAAFTADLDAALHALEIEPEKRNFVPHVTLARLRIPRDITGLLPTLGDRQGAHWSFHQACLFSSDLAGAGPRYTALRRSRFRLSSPPLTPGSEH